MCGFISGSRFFEHELLGVDVQSRSGINFFLYCYVGDIEILLIFIKFVLSFGGLVTGTALILKLSAGTYYRKDTVETT